MLRVNVRNDLSELETLTSSLQASARKAGLSDTLQHRVSIIVEELFVNFVHHSAAETGRFEVAVETTNGGVLLRLADDGEPFNPLASETPDVSASLDDRDVGGMGLHLVQQFANEITYQRTETQNVVEIRLSDEAPS